MFNIIRLSNMPTSNHNFVYNFTLIAGSIFLCVLLLLSGEMVVRLFSDINFLGNSSNLFVANAYGTSMGNARNSEAESFGIKVYTDEYGFRIDKDTFVKDRKYENSILILGDSVVLVQE